MTQTRNATPRYPLPSDFVRRVRSLFDLRGYLVLSDALGPSEVQTLRRDVEAGGVPARGDRRAVLGDSDALLSLADHPRVLPYALALMGGALHVVASSVTVVPDGAEPMRWHEDGPRPWSYPTVDGRRPLVLLRAGVFLDDLRRPDRGQLVVAPGSHQVPFHRAERPEALVGAGMAEPVCVPAGGVVLMHNALWHSTAPNRMGAPRVAVYWVYAPLWHRGIDYARPPAAWEARAAALLPEARRPLARQLIGCQPPGGQHAFQFPSEADCPGLALVTPERPASGA